MWGYQACNGAGRECRYSGARRGIGGIRGHWVSKGVYGESGPLGASGVSGVYWGAGREFRYSGVRRGIGCTRGHLGSPRGVGDMRRPLGWCQRCRGIAMYWGH